MPAIIFAQNIFFIDRDDGKFGEFRDMGLILARQIAQDFSVSSRSQKIRSAIKLHIINMQWLRAHK